MPEFTIRKLVANALIHQNVQIGGASAIIGIHSNRVEISNPEEPIVELERLIDGFQSRKLEPLDTATLVSAGCATHEYCRRPRFILLT